MIELDDGVPWMEHMPTVFRQTKWSSELESFGRNWNWCQTVYRRSLPEPIALIPCPHFHLVESSQLLFSCTQPCKSYQNNVTINDLISMAQRVRSTHNQYVTACMHQEDESSKDILHTSNSAAAGSICPSIVIAAGRSVLVLRTRASHRLRRGSPHRMEESIWRNCTARKEF